MDVHNRYATTVMLTEEPLGRVARCSAVLLSPRVALTAASCMCSPKRNSVECPERTFLRTVHYGEVKVREFMEETTSKSFRTFEGRVRPHPEFKMVLDAQGELQSADADLAVIILDSSVQDPLSFFPLGQREVQEGEVLVMAGYPTDARFGGFGSIRYFRQNKVTRIAESHTGRLLYEQQGLFLYNGYPGGPCLREEQGRQWLVGIASVGSDQELSFTSTYLFRDWLSAELQRAASMDSSPIPPPGR